MNPIAPMLLHWFYQNQRTLPFRQDPTPYHVWVSEIMLQQTRVSAALPYYQRWMEQLPTIADLAACPEEKLHKLWEGLGYYSRVRNLQKSARMVMELYNGQLPASYEALEKLPGIGAYTAGAIASISFGLAVPAVDGNVLRVFSRLYADSSNILDPAVKRTFTARVMEHQPANAPGDYNQALMELGALVCLPNGEPLCTNCPLNSQCLAYAKGIQKSLPVKSKARPRRVQPVTVLLVHSSKGWLLGQRAQQGLLAGLWQPFLVEDRISLPDALERLKQLGLHAQQEHPLPASKHIFSHIEWHMQGWAFACDDAALPDGFVWANAQQLEELYTLPGAFKAYRPLMLKDAL